jgi:hypothetical protein
MNLDGAQLARAMFSIHETEMRQAARYPGIPLSDRIERRIILDPRGSRTLSRLGRFLIRTGQRLQQVEVPQSLPLRSHPVQR